jgi:hypothetical protein
MRSTRFLLGILLNLSASAGATTYGSSYDNRIWLSKKCAAETITDLRHGKATVKAIQNGRGFDLITIAAHDIDTDWSVKILLSDPCVIARRTKSTHEANYPE